MGESGADGGESVHAAAVATGKSFKMEIDDPKKGKFYLADATVLATTDASKAMTCELDDDVIKCNGKGFPNYAGDMVKLATTGNSKGWFFVVVVFFLWCVLSFFLFCFGLG